MSLKFNADLIDTEGKYRVVEFEFQQLRINDLELRKIIAKELPGWQLLSTWH